MEEKIKIYVPESINRILLKDMELFEMFKKDGSLNKNEFYNTLIVNYYRQYQEKTGELFSQICSTIKSSSSLNESNVNEIASSIVQLMRHSQFDDDKASFTEVALSMKPTKKSKDVIDFITDCYLDNMSLSGYFRNMFFSYTMLPQDKRERIIFKDHFEKIEEAMEKGRKIYFSTKRSEKKREASVYMIASSKEELFNYVLLEIDGKPATQRVNRIASIMILNEISSVSVSTMNTLEKMREQGPQYTYREGETGEIKVRLTEQGKRLYKAIYLQRPPVKEIQDDIYTFSCSAEQAMQYFRKFGKNAVVVYPSTLTDDLYNFYSGARRVYKNEKYSNSLANDEE
ncbi:MAG: WYL domain-containing protein [Clostridia bacterium]|nr:WYL domain-containing protein [Clostridia bacterium]